MPEIHVLSPETTKTLTEITDRLGQNVDAYEFEIDRLQSYRHMVEQGRLPESRLREEIVETARRLRRTAVSTARMPLIRRRAEQPP